MDTVCTATAATTAGVYGKTSNTNEWNPAVYGRNEGDGDGVYKWIQSRHGVYGMTQSSDATDAGVYGTNKPITVGLMPGEDLVSAVRIHVWYIK